MCGICGSVGRADPGLLERMCALQAHRGPDAQGVRTFEASGSRPPAGLGHRRLSIIDPEPRSEQPMSFADGRYWITYNGELYNFEELRGELESAGVSFRTRSDTEVLLALYARDGEAMLERLQGMFAFAIWDAHEGRLFLARDRFGIKPLHFAEHEGCLYFSSEIKGLLAAVPRPSMSPSALADFLTFLWVPEPATLFEGIRTIEPGHCATYERGRLEVRRWWDLEFEVEPDRSEGEWAERVRDALQTAIRDQTVSDVPVGAFLSGGIDSGAVVAEMKRHAGEVTTYAVGYSERDLAHDIVPDDLRYARSLAGELGANHHERVLSPDVVELLPKLVWHMDSPIADPAAVSTYLICRSARERLTVILSGMGGDEVFAGYPRHLAAKLTRRADLLPAPVRRAARRALEGRLGLGRPGRMRGPRRNLLKLMRGIDQPAVERYLTYCSYYRPDELPSVMSEELRAATRGHDPFARHREAAARASGEDWLNQLLYVDAKTFLPFLNLAYTDRMSMAASTEVRVPFLDEKLIEVARRVPPELKLNGRRRKYVLKRAMEGVLPEEIIWRPKAGFGGPIRSWLVNELRPMVDDLLSPEAVRSRGLLDPGAVERIVADNDAGREDNALRIWTMLVLELWQRTYVDADPTSAVERAPNPALGASA